MKQDLSLEQGSLIKRHDFSGARLFLEHALQKGSAPAAFMMAETHDWRMLRSIQGVWRPWGCRKGTGILRVGRGGRHREGVGTVRSAVCLMEKPPKKPPQYRPQPKAQHYGQDPRLKRREANNLVGVDTLCLYLTGVGGLSL